MSPEYTRNQLAPLSNTDRQILIAAKTKGSELMSIPCLIDNVSLPECLNVRLNGLLVIVGPNSSGKTQFLHDMHEAICGKPRRLVVASGISFNQQLPCDAYLDYLLDNGVLENIENRNGPRASRQK